MHLPLRRRQRRAPPAGLLIVSLGSAAALGIVLYAVATSLPYLASSPTTDPNFGVQNQCLMTSLAPPRVGFAVSRDGSEVAGYSGAALAVCSRSGPARTFPVHGVQQAAWDGHGTLWLATSESPDAGWRLWLAEADGGLTTAGDFAPIALAGHATGSVALDAAGKLVSLDGDGQVLGWAQLPAAPVGPVELAVNADGSVAAVVAGGGLFAYRAANLAPVRAEAPCDSEYLWWHAQGTGALLSCGPRGSFALSLDLVSGEREASPARSRQRSALVPGLGVYVQSCEQLPCTAPPP